MAKDKKNKFAMLNDEVAQNIINKASLKENNENEKEEQIKEVTKITTPKEKEIKPRKKREIKENNNNDDVKATVSFQITESLNKILSKYNLSQITRFAEKLYYEDENCKYTYDMVKELRKNKKVNKSIIMDMTADELKERAEEKGFKSYSSYLLECLEVKHEEILNIIKGS